MEKKHLQPRDYVPYNNSIKFCLDESIDFDTFSKTQRFSLVGVSLGSIPCYIAISFNYTNFKNRHTRAKRKRVGLSLSLLPSDVLFCRRLGGKHDHTEHKSVAIIRHYTELSVNA